VFDVLFVLFHNSCLVSHWPPASEIAMLLITTLVELRVVAGRSRTRAGNPQAVSRRTCCAVALRRTAWSERGMASVNQTRPHCVNQMGKTHSKPWAARHGRGTACYVWIGLKSATREPEALSLTHHTLHTVLILKPGQCPGIFKINIQAHYYNLKNKIHLSHTPSQEFIVVGS
jgi:hypothetical protein